MIFTRQSLYALSYGCAVEALKWVKITSIFGAKAGFFALNQCLAPIAGFFGGIQAVSLVFIIRSLIALIFHSCALAALTFTIPSFIGGLYLASPYRSIKALIPASCIILFLVHPVGLQSSLICLYWLPPLILSFISFRSIFLASLATTLTTHAVGTIVWLYTHPTTPIFWQSLLGIIWIERLLFAATMTTAYYGFTYLIHACKLHYHSQWRWLC